MKNKKYILVLVIVILGISFFCIHYFTKQNISTAVVIENTANPTITSTQETTNEPNETEKTEDEMLMYKNSDFIEKEQPSCFTSKEN